MKRKNKSSIARRAGLADRELNLLMHDAICSQLLDEMGAPTTRHGFTLSICGRLRQFKEIFCDGSRVFTAREHAVINKAWKKRGLAGPNRTK